MFRYYNAITSALLNPMSLQELSINPADAQSEIHLVYGAESVLFCLSVSHVTT
jgi:hypothetical protein